MIPPANIVTVLNATSSLSGFGTSLQVAGLADSLGSTSNVTVFPPLNTAFAALPIYVLNYLFQPQGRSDLQQVLSFHVVPNAVIYSSTVTTTPATHATLNGQTVTVVLNGTTIQVDQASVVTTDVIASNGVGQVINR